jgi:uroporphyrin-III C-methyltransferase/precorrin-2 dehydrogenase/sirohydrochlorin ferrochelatase/uroporphyrin-III C-methyltransferase
MATKGLVSLVGSGPGDPDLLTVKALRRLQQADVVVFDRLVGDEILELIPAGVSQISVGKAPGRHCMPQQRINEILVSLASSGRRVVRLKGGDPYIFGRGGEEALVLREHGIPFEVVPGVTAAAGCGSYSGIPLTHRGMNHGVRFLAGHLHDDDSLQVDWRKIADPDCTLVVYMGLANLEKICAELIGAGLAADMPAAAIHGGTTGHQRKVIATLADLAAEVADAGLRSPVTVIVGKVVALSDALDWFQQEISTEREGSNDEALGLARA